MNLISDVCAVTSSDIVRDIGHNLDLEDEAGSIEVGAEEVRMRVATQSRDAACCSRHAPPPGPGSQ